MPHPSNDTQIATDPFEQALLRADPRTLTAAQARERERLLYGDPELAKAAPELSEQVKALIADARAAAEARAATDRRRRAGRAARRLATRMGHDLGLIEDLTAAQLAALQGLGRLMLDEQHKTGTASCDLALAIIAEESGVARSTLIATLAHAVHRGWIRRISYRPEIDPETNQLVQTPSTYLPGPLMDRVMVWLTATPEPETGLRSPAESTSDRKIGQTGFGVSESNHKESSIHPESGGRAVRAGQARPARPIAQRPPSNLSATPESLSSQPILLAPEGEHGISVGTPPPSVCASAAAGLVLRGLKLLGEPVGDRSETALLAAVWRAHGRFAQDWLKSEDLARAIRVYGWWAAACLVSTIIERAVRTRKPLTNPAGRFFWLVWKAVKQIPDPLAIPISIIDRHGSIGGEIAPAETTGGEIASAPAGDAAGDPVPTAGPVPSQKPLPDVSSASSPARLSPELDRDLDAAIAWARTLGRSDLLGVIGRLQIPPRARLASADLRLGLRLIAAWRTAMARSRNRDMPEGTGLALDGASAAPEPSRAEPSARAETIQAMRWFAALPAHEHARMMESRGRKDRVAHVLEAWRKAMAENAHGRSDDDDTTLSSNH